MNVLGTVCECMTTCVCPGIHGYVLMYYLCTFIGERLTMKKLQDNMEDDSDTGSDGSHTISLGS